MRTQAAVLSVALLLSSALAGVAAEKKYDVGATDSEIKLGNTAPYSGPGSAYGAFARAQEAYFKKVNEEGGINGRLIKYLSYDDAGSPPKTVEQVRKLVESDEVLAVVSPIGTAANAAIQRYMNNRKVPQLLAGSGATRWADPENFPWTMGWLPSYQSEGRIYANYLLKENPNAKVAILFQNDDFGKDYVKGLKDGLGAAASKMIVAQVSYELTQPTIDSQIAALKSSGADTLYLVAVSKFAAQSLRKVAELDWKPLVLMTSVSTSVSAILEPAGLDNAKGVVSAVFLKDVTDPQWKDDAEARDYTAFVAKYMPNTNKADNIVVSGYITAQVMVQILRQCGDDLTRENVMRQAANLKDFRAAMLLPGIVVSTSPTDFRPLEHMQLMRFNGLSWDRFGSVMSGELGD